MGTGHSAFRFLFAVALAAAASISMAAAASAAGKDKTDAVLEEFKKIGITDLGTFEIGEIKLRLQLSKRAQAIVTEKKFDITDATFEQEKFNAFVVARFTESLTYFQKIVPAAGIKELFLIIDDLGEDRKGTISETRVLSRVIASDIRRWHKFYLGRNAFLADLTAIHGFTHVANYVLDGEEVKLHRELVAIVFESLNLIRMNGEEAYRKNYLLKVAGPLSSPDQVLNENFMGNGPLRHVAWSFITKVLDGTYGVTGDRFTMLQDFALRYLSDKGTGATGFDAALQQTKITDSSGKALRLTQVQKDLHAELSRPKL